MKLDYLPIQKACKMLSCITQPFRDHFLYQEILQPTKRSQWEGVFYFFLKHCVLQICSYSTCCCSYCISEVSVLCSCHL